jgi:ADP-heptose:LPS heptosyltransferase
MAEATPRRICVIFPGALGDFLCFLPTLCSLAADAAQVDLFARTEFADLAPPAVKVRSSECHEISALFIPGAGKDHGLCDFFGGYDCIYSWHGSQEREFVRSLGLVSKGRVRLFAFRPSKLRIHQADYYLSCIAEARHLTVSRIIPKPEAIAWSEDYWVRHSLKNKPVLALAAGSGAREKNWPLTSYCAVAEWWRSQTKGAVLALIGPVEEERGGLGPLLECSVAARNLKLGQVAALLSRSTIYLGNDSGITHLAAAVGARTIALFGPSDMSQWAPRGERVTILNRNVECSPCDLTTMKNCSHRKCLTQFPADKVIAELANLPEMANLTRLGPGIRV